MKRLSELEWNEVEELYEINSWLRDQIAAEAEYKASIDLDDIANVFRRSPGVADFELGGNADFIKIKDHKYCQFLFAVKELDDEGMISVSTDMVPVMTEAMNWDAWFWDMHYASAEEGDEFYDEYYANFMSKIEKIIEEVLESIHEMDDNYRSAWEYFLDHWVEYQGDGYMTDGRYIYEADITQYA